MGQIQEYNIGYNPETVQARWNNPQTSPFGNAIRSGFSPYIGVNYEWFQYDPFYWPLNYYGRQAVGIKPVEYLHGEYTGYRGILPMRLFSVSPENYPYQNQYPFNYSA